jgi:hypothetical protein
MAGIGRRTRRALLWAPLLAVPVIGSARTAVSAYPSSQERYVYWLNEVNRRAIRRFGAMVLDRLADWQMSHSGMDTFRDLVSPRWWSNGGADFSRLLSRVRAPLGALRERVEAGIDGGFHRLPNLPPGSYAIASWDVLFEKTPYIYTEQLTLENHDGHLEEWKLAGYYLSPKPYFEYP